MSGFLFAAGSTVQGRPGWYFDAKGLQSEWTLGADGTMFLVSEWASNGDASWTNISDTTTAYEAAGDAYQHAQVRLALQLMYAACEPEMRSGIAEIPASTRETAEAIACAASALQAKTAEIEARHAYERAKAEVKNGGARMGASLSPAPSPGAEEEAEAAPEEFVTERRRRAREAVAARNAPQKAKEAEEAHKAALLRAAEEAAASCKQEAKACEAKCREAEAAAEKAFEVARPAACPHVMTRHPPWHAAW